VSARTTDDVLQDHLRRRQAGDLEGDFAHNYAPDVVILCKDGAFEGHVTRRRAGIGPATHKPSDRRMCRSTAFIS
jgi:hypothetical protein